MKKSLLLSFLLFPFCLNAQIVSTTFEGAYVYIPQNPVDFKKPFLFKVGIENWFCNRFAMGVNFQGGNADIEDAEYTTENSQIVREQDLEVSNLVMSINFYPKFALFTGDDYSISIKPEFGICWQQSRPEIYNTNFITREELHENLDWIVKKSISLGIGVQGQYFITNRCDICLNLGYNNYDLGKTLNSADLKNKWTHGFNEKTCFLSAGLGIHYYILGADKR